MAQQSLQTGNTHPVAPENAYLKQSFEVPRPVQPTQLVPQQTGAQNSPAPVRKSLDRPVSFRQQETRGFPNQMAQAGFHHQRRGHPPQTQIYYNPSKSEIGITSENILDRINKEVIQATKVNLWKSTNNTIEWFKEIPEKEKHAFVTFDVCIHIYLSIHI